MFLQEHSREWSDWDYLLREAIPPRMLQRESRYNATNKWILPLIGDDMALLRGHGGG